MLPHLREGDWVYIDPPYMPLNETSNFTEYTSAGFSTQDHVNLKSFCDELNSRNIKFLMSNSSTQSVRDLYSEYHIDSVSARRSINSNGARRGPVDELLISNYQ
jgi:DNA adenine methylase